MKTHSILVVDDTEASRYIFMRMLTRAGYRVLEAADGASALRELDQQRPDLVVLDVQLPDMLGFQVCRAIKQTPDAPKVVQTSASFTQPEARIEGIECGADAYLVQPMQPGEFLATVSSLLRLRDAEMDLREANLRLMRSNRDLEHFAHIASHDLQEPLRSIISFLDLLSYQYGTQLDARAQTYIGYAVAGATRMSTLIRDLLALSQSQIVPHVPQLIAADLLLDDALADLEVRIKESQAVIERGELPRIWADRTQLTRVFQNLISNAIKFRSPQRRLLIRIGCTTSHGLHTFTVADNGLGIPSEAQSRIFGLFQRNHPDIPGNGIGLAMVQRIIERHHGQVAVTSQVDEGASFTFTIAVPTAQAS
jgi:signal transduction histidine kinase